MGDSGGRKERIKIPLIGWEVRAGEKDARFGGRLRVKFPKLSRVKLKAVFVRGRGKRGGDASTSSGMTQAGAGSGLVPRLQRSDCLGLIPSSSESVWELENRPRIGPRPVGPVAKISPAREGWDIDRNIVRAPEARHPECR
jgi:hypothetical protein